MEHLYEAYKLKHLHIFCVLFFSFFSGHLCFFMWDKSYYEESEDVIFDTLELASNLTARHKFDRQSLAGFYQPDEWCVVQTFYRLEFCWTYLFDVCLVGRFAY